MTWLVIAVGGAVAASCVVAFFAWGNRWMAKRHAQFTAKDVEDALAEVLDPNAPTHDGFDLFLSWPINDPELEAVRLECQKICRECPPAPGKDFNEEGEQRIAALLADLQRRREDGR